MSNDPRVLVLEEMRKQTRLLGAILLALNETRTITPANAEAKLNDRVCNGPQGDPLVKAKSPRDWSGPDMKGRKFSECPPDYLDLLAARYDYFAEKAERAKQDATDDAELHEAEKSLKYARLDAQRCRGWAARLRAGYVAPTTPAPQPHEGEPTW